MRSVPSIRAAALGFFLAACAARAAVRVEFEGIDGPLLDNVRLHVGSPPGDAPLVLRRFAHNARDRALEALEALGRCDASVRVSFFADGNDRVLRFAILPGEPVLLSSVSVAISGEAASDPAFADLRARLPLRPGEPLDHGQYEEAKRSIESLALSRGYFNAAFSTNQILVHRGRRCADVSLAFDSGPRFRLGEVRIPTLPISRTLLLRLVPFRGGDPYSADQISALQRNFVDSDFFEDVLVRPRPDLAGDSFSVPVDADLSLAPRNRIGLGLGATTDVGPRLRLEWRRPWTNRRGHSALIKSEASLVRQNLSALYSIPLNPPLDHQLQFSGEWKREDVEDTESETRRVGVQRRRLRRNGWEQVVFLRRESERFTQAGVREATDLTLPGFSLGRTRRRGGVIPARGDRLFALFETAHPDFFSDVRLSRILLQARRLDSFGPHSLLARIEYGALDTGDFDRTPPSLRFFAGGDQSVRGFAYQSLGPKNDQGELLGGRYLLAGSLEYNYQFASRWKLAAFFDAGNASADAQFSEGLAHGAGAGIRWLSPLAPVKLDFAWGVSESRPPFRIHFSMGIDL